MFAPEGYVPLARLWGEFIQQHAEPLCLARRAQVASMPESEVTALSTNGSPADFVEQIFIRTFDDTTLFLCGPGASRIEVIASDPNGYSRRLERLSAFEASIAATDANKAHKNRPWLTRLGTYRFSEWPTGVDDNEYWKEIYLTGEHGSTPFGRLPFHTVPYIFKRNLFVLPEDLPPWADDAIDETFVRSVLPHALGHSFCLDLTQARTWGKKTCQVPLGEPGSVRTQT